MAAVGPLVEHMLSSGAHGMYIAGGTGEMNAMDVAQRKVMAAESIKCIAGRVPAVVCVGQTDSIAEAVELAQHAKDCGADGISATVPKWNTGDLDATVELYKAIGDVGLPFYAYWVEVRSCHEVVRAAR